MDSQLTSLGGQLMDMQNRQFVVFEEVLENFEEKCCEPHDKLRQNVVHKARTAFKLLQALWAAKETTDQKLLSKQAKDSGRDYTEIAANRDNLTYHWFSLVLALWCQKLSQVQKYFEKIHGHLLLDMKMPPGSHEISQNQFIIQFYIAKMSYLNLTMTEPEKYPVPCPWLVFFLLQVAGRCRDHPNPIMYHKFCILFNLIVRAVNEKTLHSSIAK